MKRIIPNPCIPVGHILSVPRDPEKPLQDFITCKVVRIISDQEAEVESIEERMTATDLKELIGRESYYGLNLAYVLRRLEFEDPNGFNKLMVLFQTAENFRKDEIVDSDITTTLKNWK